MSSQQQPSRRSEKVLHDARMALRAASPRATHRDVGRPPAAVTPTPVTAETFSLPPPFPPIRFRRAEEEDLYRTSSTQAAPAFATHAEERTYDFTSDFLQRDHRHAQQWRAEESSGNASVRDAAARAALRAECLEATVAAAVREESRVIEALGGPASLYTAATDKGIVVPYTWFAEVSEAMERSLADLQDVQRRRAALEREKAAIDNIVGAAKDADPQSHTPPPLIYSDAAVQDAASRAAIAGAAAVVWRMLRQVVDVVPGMSTALALYRNVLLPNLFVNMEANMDKLPPMASMGTLVAFLGDERMQLAPTEYRDAREHIQILRDRTDYMRTALENWGFQIWRGNCRAGRRKEATLERLGNLLGRVPSERAKRRVFQAWRAFTTESKLERVQNTFESAYQRFVDTSAAEGMAHKETEKQLTIALGARAQGAAGGARKESAGALELVSQRNNITSDTAQSMLGAFSALLEEKEQEAGGGDKGAGNTAKDRADACLAQLMLVFNDAMRKVHQLDAVGQALRAQSSSQVTSILKLERINADLTAKTAAMEQKLLDAINERLALQNVLQEREVELLEKERAVRRLQSKNKLQLHGPWRRVAMRTLAAVAGVTVLEEEADADADRHLQPQDSFADPVEAFSSLLPTREELNFGRLAPLVICNTHRLADPLVLLLDWTNACLGELHDLDGRGDAGANAARLTDIADLGASSVLPRLLYFLALPLYRPVTAAQEELCGVADTEIENRLRLLRGERVRLNPPTPPFAACFGEALRESPVFRAEGLLDFASDLIARSQESPPQFHSVPPQRDTVGPSTPATRAVHAFLTSQGSASGFGGYAETPSEDGDAWPLPPNTGTFLPDIRDLINPVLLAGGCRATALTLLATLYVHFAHPFNHKSSSERAEEEALLRHLATEARVSRQALERAFTDQRLAITSALSPTSTLPNPMQDILDAFAVDDKSPWQLYFEHCRPLACSGAHAFVMAGGFWDPRCMESSEAMQIFARVMCALRASLERHRTHVLMTCLVTGPVASPGGGKAVFNGPLGSPLIFLAEKMHQPLDAASRIEDCDESEVSASAVAATARWSLDPRALATMILYRGDVVPDSDAWACERPPHGHVQTGGARLALVGPSTTPQSVRLVHDSIAGVLEKYSVDLADLFLSRCTSLSQPLPRHRRCGGSWANLVWNLPAWRSFWRDIGIPPSVLDDELLTDLFRLAGGAARLPIDDDDSNASGSSLSSSAEGGPASTIALLETFNWSTYWSMREREGLRVPPSDDTSQFAVFPPAGRAGSPCLLPCTLASQEVLMRSVQELDADEWVEAVTRTVALLAPLELAVAPDDMVAELSRYATTDGYVPIAAAMLWFVSHKILALSVCKGTPFSTRLTLRTAVQGAYTQEVLRFHHTALYTIFSRYGRYRGPPLRDIREAQFPFSFTHTAPVSDVTITLDCADFVAILRDAQGIFGGEVTQTFVTEVFRTCAVEMRDHCHQPIISAIANVARVFAPRPPAQGPLPASPPPARVNLSLAAAAVSKTLLLTYDHFPLALAVLAQVKFPNPLVPIHERLHNFLTHYMEGGPMRVKLPALQAALAQRRGQAASVVAAATFAQAAAPSAE